MNRQFFTRRTARQLARICRELGNGTGGKPRAAATPLSPERMLWETLCVASPWLVAIIIAQAVLTNFKEWGEGLFFPCAYLGTLLLLRQLLARAAGTPIPCSSIGRWCLRSPARKVVLLLHLLLGLLLTALWQQGLICWPLWCLLPWLLCWPAQRARLPELRKLIILVSLPAFLLACLFTLMLECNTHLGGLFDTAAHSTIPNPLEWLPNALTCQWSPSYQYYQFAMQLLAAHLAFLLGYFLLGGHRFIANIAEALSEQSSSAKERIKSTI